LEGIDGGFAPGLIATGESDLDLQISYPIIYPQNSIIFQTDDINYSNGVEGGGGFLKTFFDAIDGSYCTSSAFGETVGPISAIKYLSNTRRETHPSTQCTQIPSFLDTKASSNVEPTSPQTSSQSPTVNNKTTSQPTTNNANARR